MTAVVAGAAAAALLAAACTNTDTSGRSDSGKPGSETREKAAGDDIPATLAEHLEQLKESIPGNGGESEEGPASWADDEFRKRAYPAATISLAKAQSATRAFRRAESRLTLGKAPSRSWDNVGPRRAVYPFTPLRNSASYVPNRYIAGGRTTDLAIGDTCTPGDCRMWVTPAGGGVWRTNDALAKPPDWRYLGGPLGINAVGSITVDPTDSSGDTIWVGTGEANICGSGCVAGVGLYKSTNGGNSWLGPFGRRTLGGKGIGDLAIDPRNGTLYAATTTALRGMSSVCCSGVTRPVPGAARWGLYKSTDGGHSWRLIHNGSAHKNACRASADEFNNLDACSPRGVRFVELDPSNPSIVYASSFARGIWRSTDRGRTWTKIKQSLNRDLTPTLAAIDVTTLANGDTRMYAYEGNVGVDHARLFRSDDVASGAPVFNDLTSPDPADPGYATFDQCGGQCWYDIFVHTPAGHPNMVYTGGSYGYGETGGISNGRAVVFSADAGVSGTDMTMDGTDAVHPNGLHPDQHAIVTAPNRPRRFFVANDGGVMRSTGAFADRSSWCGARGLAGDELTRCRQLLSRVPRRLLSQNKGLSTLQFQSLSVSPFDS
ncbi:MAG: exo-alpha-sialidase, partial [Propionibacteriales bacterium]|nr:exo-alpha-sialidase [Propionibacteriales bacterium]